MWLPVGTEHHLRIGPLPAFDHGKWKSFWALESKMKWRSKGRRSIDLDTAGSF